MASSVEGDQTRILGTLGRITGDILKPLIERMQEVEKLAAASFVEIGARLDGVDARVGSLETCVKALAARPKSLPEDMMARVLVELNTRLKALEERAASEKGLPVSVGQLQQAVQSHQKIIEAFIPRLSALESRGDGSAVAVGAIAIKAAEIIATGLQARLPAPAPVPLILPGVAVKRERDPDSFEGAVEEAMKEARRGEG